MERAFEDLVNETDSASVEGWDFSWLDHGGHRVMAAEHRESHAPPPPARRGRSRQP